MELEAALRAREGGVNGRLEEGDASGQQLASARRLRSLLSSNRFGPALLVVHDQVVVVRGVGIFLRGIVFLRPVFPIKRSSCGYFP